MVNRVELAAVVHHKVRKFAVVPKVVELALKGGVVFVFVVVWQRFLRRRQQVMAEKLRKGPYLERLWVGYDDVPVVPFDDVWFVL